MVNGARAVSVNPAMVSVLLGVVLLWMSEQGVQVLLCDDDPWPAPGRIDTS